MRDRHSHKIRERERETERERERERWIDRERAHNQCIEICPVYIMSFNANISLLAY